MLWNGRWKKRFDLRAGETAKLLDSLLGSPLVLEPAGAVLTMVMRVRRARKKAVESFVHALGLASGRDQERLLHAFHQLSSRVIKLQDRQPGDGLEPDERKV